MFLLCSGCRGGGQDVEMADCSSMMSATQEACQAELEMADAMCSSSIGFSGSAAALTKASDGLPGRQLQEADWQEIVYKVSICSMQKLLVDLVLKRPCFMCRSCSLTRCRKQPTAHPTASHCTSDPGLWGHMGAAFLLYQRCQCQVEYSMCTVSSSYNDSCLLNHRPAC